MKYIVLIEGCPGELYFDDEDSPPKGQLLKGDNATGFASHQAAHSAVKRTVLHRKAKGYKAANDAYVYRVVRVIESPRAATPKKRRKG